MQSWSLLLEENEFKLGWGRRAESRIGSSEHLLVFWLMEQMLRMDEISGDCNHMRMTKGEELFKLED